MNNLTATLLVLTVLLVVLPKETYAFGAGDIPDFAYLNDKAFRHGDIESILSELLKSTGKAAGGGGLLAGLAHSFLNSASGGAKFSKEDIKKVYFGNWLRDYSQAMDIAGLSKLSADTLVLIVSVLGFLTFGFATEEFQVTPERLGVYLPVEHIDNPKGYGEEEGDARIYHPKLRPPVNPRELEIDESTGMKKYMATENHGWDTSTALVRRVFRACIQHGRRAQGEEGADLWEAYRLLGTGLHTMEDLLAHSNWCELALRKMGHEDVFCHVGESVIISTPNGPAPPLITGTFGSADFLHSLMGEATDHLSQASVVDLSKKMSDAQNDDSSSFGNLQEIFKNLPIGGSTKDSDMDKADNMHAKAKAYEFNPDDIAPPAVQEQLWELLKWRDNIYRDIIKKIEMVPGLEGLIDSLTNALNAFVYTVLAPYLSPILKQVTSVLGEGSKAVIDSDDQYEVFNDPEASDPSHSLLSKDHFALILNEPAGKVALVVVQYSVKLIVEAWFDEDIQPDQVIDRILEAFHHPYYATGRSRIQQEMYQCIENWLSALGPDEAEETLQALTKESVREGKNKRKGSDDDMAESHGVYGGHPGQEASGAGEYQPSQTTEYGASQSGYAASSDRYGAARNDYNSARTSEGADRYGSSRNEYDSSPSYGDRHSERVYDEEPPVSYAGAVTESYDGNTGEYGGREDDGHDGRYRAHNAYGAEPSYETRPDPPHVRRQHEHGGYQPAYREPTSYDTPVGYGAPLPEPPYGAPGRGGYGEKYEGRENAGYGRPEREEGGGYKSRREEAPSGYGRGGYGGPEREGYGEPPRQNRYGGGYGGPEREGYGEPPRQNQYGGGGYETPQYGNQRGQEGEYGRAYPPLEPSGERFGYGNESGGGGGYEGRAAAGYGDSSETFGAERLTLDDGEERHAHHGHHHHMHHDEDEGGY